MTAQNIRFIHLSAMAIKGEGTRIVTTVAYATDGDVVRAQLTRARDTEDTNTRKRGAAIAGGRLAKMIARNSDQIRIFTREAFEKWIAEARNEAQTHTKSTSSLKQKLLESFNRNSTPNIQAVEA